MTGPRITQRLAVIRGVCGVLADDLRNHAGDHRCARAVLVALVYAIENDSLDSLYQPVQAWMAAEVARVDALKEAEPPPVWPFTVASAFDMEPIP